LAGLVAYIFLFSESPHGIHFGDLGPGDKGDINVDGIEVE
jgi:hypothetical protein